MARIRTIKPALFTSRKVSAWPVGIRWTWAGLFTYADDYGFGIDDPRLVKAELYPLDDAMTPKKINQHLDIIAGQGPLCRYTGSDGEAYLHIPSWGEHQRVNRPTASKFPACPAHPNQPRNHE